MHIVVKTAHQEGVDFILDAQPVQTFAHFFEVIARFFAEHTGIIRHIGDDFAAGIDLTVKNTPHVALQAFAAIFAQRINMLEKIFFQRRRSSGTVGRHTAGIEFERSAGNAQLFQKTEQHCDHFRIQLRSHATDIFHADLVELTATPRRRTFAAEHGADVEHALFHAIEYISIEQSAHHPGSTFWAQSHAAAAAVLKGIHLFLNHFGFIAQTALKNFGCFKNRSTQFAVVITFKNITGSFFQKTPRPNFGRKNIRSSGQRCGFSHL